MQATRALLLAVLVVASMAALPLSAGGFAAPDATPGADDAVSPPAAADRLEPDVDDRAVSTVPDAGPVAFAQEGDDVPTVDEDDDPTTSGTLGYVEGIRYDQELAVDDRDSAVLDEDDLEEVVHRAMARVEMIRELPFQREVPVEPITREEFQADEDVLGDVTEAELRYENVRLEALFMADRDEDALDEYETVYGDSVAGFYRPETDRIVLVSENPDEPELDELTLGHELVHALQDQHYDLTSYDRDTQDLDNARNGLIEGDASWVEETYAERCGSEWTCTIPSEGDGGVPSDFNWGLYFTMFQPYEDGPEYVEHLYETGGWDAVDAAYDEPPASSSEVIRPGEERVPRPIEVEDRSSDAWEQYEFDGEVANDTVGEAGMVAMFADGVLEDGEPSVLDVGEFIDTGPLGNLEGLEYDQPQTDGWAGDELVVYVGAEESAAESGYVWRTEWTAEDDAADFLEAYLTLLANHGAEAVDGHRNAFEIEDGYPGAYAVEYDGETATIVRAPSVDELSEIEPGVAPEGEADTLAIEDGEGVVLGEGTDDGDGATDNDGDGTTDDGGGADDIPGFAVGAAVLGLLVGTVVLQSRG